MQYDKTNKELGEVSVIEDRIALKAQGGWGEGPLNYLKEQTKLQRQKNE